MAVWWDLVGATPHAAVLGWGATGADSCEARLLPVPSFRPWNVSSRLRQLRTVLVNM
jgi:hypothetical protein